MAGKAKVCAFALVLCFFAPRQSSNASAIPLSFAALMEIVGAMKTAYDVYDKGAGAVSWIIGIDELTLEAARAQIIDKMLEIRDSEIVWDIDGLIVGYQQYIDHPTDELLVEWLSEAWTVKTNAEGVLRSDDFWSAVVVIKAYVLFVPIYAYMSKEYGNSDEWVRQEVFETALDINERFIGRYRFQELPNPPFYEFGFIENDCRFGSGVLRRLRCDGMTKQDFWETYSLVWQSNEFLRSVTVDDLDQSWYRIYSYGEVDMCLFADQSNNVSAKPCAEERGFYWRPVFRNFSLFQLEHVSHLCLTEDNRQAYLEPCSENESQFFEFYLGHVYGWPDTGPQEYPYTFTLWHDGQVSWGQGGSLPNSYKGAFLDTFFVDPALIVPILFALDI